MMATNKTGTVSAGGLSVSTMYTDYTNWFTAAVTLTNTTGAPLSDWTVAFDEPQPITALWGGQITAQAGASYIVHSAGWNAAVPAGGSVTFYFNANGPAPAVPSSFVVNGATLGAAAAVSGPVATTTTSAAPPAIAPATTITPQGSLSAAMTVTQNWGTGWNGLVSISDGGATVSGGWTIAFDLAATIVNLWDGVITSHVGTHYIVSNAAWDSTLSAAKIVTFGFNVAGALPALPTSFTINGATAATPTPAPVLLPSVTVAGGSVTETPSGGTEIFIVTLSTPATSAVSFTYATQDGTAVAGVDYVASSGTATIAAGQTSATVLVATRPGRTGSTTFDLVLSGLAGATMAGGGGTLAAVGTIVNAPSLSLSGTTVTETATGETTAMFAVALSSPEPVPVTVAYSTVAGTGTSGAVAGRDFTATSGTVTIAAGATGATIDVPTFAAGATATRSFTLVLSNPTNAGIASGTATATLVSTAPPATPQAAVQIGATGLLLANVTRDLTAPQGGAAGTLLPGGYLHTSGNQIVSATGQDVRIAAVSWFGFDNTTATPGGLDTQSYKTIMDRMVEAGFNTLRLPFSNAFLAGAVTPSYINTKLNPDLAGLSNLAMMDRIVAYAAQIGLKVILDDHNSSGTSGPNLNGLWYDQTYSDATWQGDWTMLAKHYAGNATVIGADLFTEPHSVATNGTLTGATWGDGSATDWQAASTRAGDAIQAVNPNWLVIVEGIQAYQNSYTNWGSNLMGVATHPVTLTDPNHLVYSAHTYPASVDPEPWFTAANYPANLASVWTQQFGYIAQQGIAPVFIGEYGSNFTQAADQQWLQALQSFANSQAGAGLQTGQQGMSTGYWAWNSAPGTSLIGASMPDYATANTAVQQAAQSLSYQAAGNANELDVAVSLAAAHTAPVTILYATQDGTAHAGTDYVATSGTLTFAPGETAKIVPALLLNPGTSAGSPSFLLNLADAQGNALGAETVTIVHDPQATVSRTSQQWSNIAYNTVTITNTSSQTINGWEVAVHTASSVMPSQVYDGQLVSAQGNDYLFTSAAWNQTIAPGASAHFEFGASQTAINTPVSVSVVHTGT